MDVWHTTPECPFCAATGSKLFEVRYSETAEASKHIPDIEGTISDCDRCGIAYPSVGFDPAEFVELYRKSLGDLSYLDDSPLQVARMMVIRRLVEARHQGGILSSALQIPSMSLATPKGVRVLDVGCGFGEFASIYQRLGATVTATEVVPELVERCKRRGLDCRQGQLEDLGLTGPFDLILFRAVLYRTAAPVKTLAEAKRLLADGGQISVIDPCTDANGIAYFAQKHWPQGRYYISDFGRFSAMLRDRCGMRVMDHRQIYGRPSAPLKQVRLIGNIVGLGELVINNIARRKPYVAAYVLMPS